MKIIKLCKKYLIKYKLMISIFILLRIGNSLIGIYLPYFTGSFIDKLVSDSSTNFIITFSIQLLVISCIMILIGFVSNNLYSKALMKINYETQRNILSHLGKISLAFFKDKDYSYLSQRIYSDINNMNTFVLNTIGNIILNILTFFVTLIVLFSINWRLGIVFTIIIILYCFIYLKGHKKIYTLNYDVMESNNEYYSNFSYNIEYIKFIRANALEKEFGNKLYEIFLILYKKGLKLINFSYLFSSSQIIVNAIAQIIIFSLGGYAVVLGELTIGSFTMLISYFNMLIKSISYFFDLGQKYQETLVSVHRLNQIYLEKEVPEGNIVPSSVSELTVKNLEFGFGDNIIISNFSCTFSKGKMYALVGENGCGKSTFLDIIIGLYKDKINGNVYFNDDEIRGIDMNLCRRNLIAISDQNNILIKDTILNNIIIGLSNSNGYTNIINDKLNIFDKENFIQSFPNGLQTKIEGSGKNVSGGERQKISLLRTLIKDSEIMIFDEPTSSLDKESKDKFLRHLQQIKKDKIIIIATHDNDLIQQSDIVINLEGM